MLELMRQIDRLAAKNSKMDDVFLLEEMSELQKELMKRRRGKENRDNIIEEAADVLLTLLTFLESYNAPMDSIYSAMLFKANRALKEDHHERKSSET